MINLECKILPRFYKCSIRLPFENPNVYFNIKLYKSTMEHSANSFSSSGWIYSHKVQKGVYKLTVVDPKGEYICEPKNVSITKDEAFAIKCIKKVKYFNPTLRLKNGGVYSKDNITIVLGNSKIEPKVSIDKKDLIIYLSNIEEGSHDLLVNIKRNKKSVLNCSHQDISITSTKEYYIEGCKEVKEEGLGFDPFTPKLFDVYMRLKDGKKYARDNISIILNGRNISAGARYENNDIIFELKNINKGAHKISINITRKEITVLSCINQQIVAGDKKEYNIEGCKEN
jgi:uncharacterized protein YaiI (UPF0178 family)